MISKKIEKYLLASGGKGGLGNVRLKVQLTELEKKTKEKKVTISGYGFN